MRHCLASLKWTYESCSSKWHDPEQARNEPVMSRDDWCCANGYGDAWWHDTRIPRWPNRRLKAVAAREKGDSPSVWKEESERGRALAASWEGASLWPHQMLKNTPLNPPTCQLLPDMSQPKGQKNLTKFHHSLSRKIVFQRRSRMSCSVVQPQSQTKHVQLEFWVPKQYKAWNEGCPPSPFVDWVSCTLVQRNGYDTEEGTNL